MKQAEKQPEKQAAPLPRPTREEAEKAVQTLIRWAGDDPAREGLRDTPRRVADAYGEFFAGYALRPEDALDTAFAEFGPYDDFVLVRDIGFASHCEHHMVPVIGRAHVAYWPSGKVAGISKLARLVECCSRRLTMQERMTGEIARALDSALAPRGAAVMVEATHHCMTIRGVSKPGSMTVTSAFTGIFAEDPALRARFSLLAGK